METNVVYQQKDKSWMINVVFYLVFSLLTLVIFSYGIFYVKAQMQLQKIAKIDEKISVYGTQEQKQNEEVVYDYKKKIDDFALLLLEHKMSSNVFNFLEANTLQGVVFLSIAMSQSNNEVRLSGESDTMATLGRQFAIFENSKDYIKTISVFNSQIVPSGKIAFVFNISLDPKIFNYGANFATP